MANAFEAAGNHDGPIVVRLSPPELGSLKLEISIRDGALTAHVQTDNSTARNVLLDNLPALRDRLEQQDIRIERFDVEVQDRSSSGQPQIAGPESRGQRHGAALPGSHNSPLTTGESAEPAVTSSGLSVVGGGQLNVVI